MQHSENWLGLFHLFVVRLTANRLENSLRLYFISSNASQRSGNKSGFCFLGFSVKNARISIQYIFSFFILCAMCFGFWGWTSKSLARARYRNWKPLKRDDLLFIRFLMAIKAASVLNRLDKLLDTQMFAIALYRASLENAAVGKL